MVKAGQGELARPGAAPDLLVGLDDQHSRVTLGQSHRGRESVGAGADDHCVERPRHVS